MCKKTLLLVSLLLLWGLAFSPAPVQGQPGLIGHWPFDETQGSTAPDVSGMGKNGTLANGVEFRPDAGLYGGALWVDPTDASGYCEVSTEGMKPSEGTVMVWGMLEDPQPSQTSYFMGHTTQPTWNDRIQLYTDSADNLLDLGLGDSHSRQTGIMDLPLETWIHIALTWDSGSYTVYIDGTEATAGSYSGLTAMYPIMDIGNDGHDQRTRAEAFGGLLDEAKIFNRALTPEEILKAMVVTKELAADPVPGDNDTDVLRDTRLAWEAGEFAVTHNLYIGTNFADVNSASVDDPLGTQVIEGLNATTYDPGILDFGQTYFWRVDEVNGAPDRTVFRGAVWNFTVEPVGYPITNVTATASSSNDADMTPEKTVDGSGLNALDQHSTVATDMWLSAAGTAPWLQYDFDKIYKLHEMWVWNSNQMIESFIGLGAKDVVVETSVDGVAWTVLEGVTQFNQATGTPDYTANTFVDFGGVLAQSVRITIHSGWGQIPQYGLSEVRFFFIPTAAREPNPADGSTTETADATLAWRAGREAASHEVNLGTDAQDLPLITTVTENSLDLADQDLQINTTYYWQITEVNDAEEPARYAGDIWSFSTPEFRVVDDFEGYDDGCGRIFFAWQDGFGHSGSEGIENCTVAPYNGNGTGSIVGNANAPFAEQTIVHSGAQSMPLEYDSGVSEATLALDGQNWAVNGIQWLSLYVYGSPGNTGQLYLKINNTKLPFDGSPSAVSRPLWTVWNVELSTLGMDLTRVNSLTLGIENASSLGMLYVDDIRLYGQAPEGVVAQDPGTDSLVAHYALENNAQDSAGNGNHGTPVGAPSYAAGITGMAMDFDAIDDRIDLGPLDIVGSGITLALWLNPDDFLYDDTRVISKATSTAANDHWWMISTNGGSHVLRFRLKTDDGQDTTTLIAGSGGVAVGEWTHAAAVWDGSAMRIFQNLQEVGNTAKGGAAVAVDPGVNAAIGNQPEGAGDKHWDGLIDEVRIYSRGLSEAELLYIASQ